MPNTITAAGKNSIRFFTSFDSDLYGPEPGG